MSDIHINGGTPLASGSVMIPPGVEAAVSVLDQPISLRFQTEGTEGYTIHDWVLTVTAQPNPLGIALKIQMPTADGRYFDFCMTVHTVGGVDAIYRIVHYTAYYVTQA